MSDDPDLEDIEEVLVSLVSAALSAAQADAAECALNNSIKELYCSCLLDRPDSKIFFHPDWEPTPRTRKSTRYALFITLNIPFPLYVGLLGHSSLRLGYETSS